MSTLSKAARNSTQYDVIVVLAGGIRDDGTLSPNVKKRIQRALQLAEMGLASRFLLSGKWSRYRETHRPPFTEAEAMSRYAQTLGIPVRHIYKEERSHDTVENAKFCQQLFLEPRNWRRLLVVTSDFHLPRVRRVFDTVLGKGYTIRYIGAKTQFHPWKWLVWTVQEKLLWKALHLWRSR